MRDAIAGRCRGSRKITQLFATSRLGSYHGEGGRSRIHANSSTFRLVARSDSACVQSMEFPLATRFRTRRHHCMSAADFNPYAAPRSFAPVEAPLDEGLWQTGQLLLMRKGTDLPDR